MLVAFALAELVGGTAFLAQNGSNCHGVGLRAQTAVQTFAGFTSVVQKMGVMAQYPASSIELVLSDHRVPEKSLRDVSCKT